MNNFILKFVYFYTKVYDFIENMVVHVRKYEYVNLFVNKCNDIMIQANAKFFNLNVEPDVPYIEVSYITKNNKLIEDINTDYKRHRVSNYFKDIVREPNLNTNKVLFIHKFKDNEDNEYIQSKLIENNNEDVSLSDVLTHIDNSKKHIKFIGIEYSNPKMKNNITLNIDSKYFVRNNDILDSIFILKYLKRNYRDWEFVFDKNYKVSLIDPNVNFHELYYNDYLHFSNDNWIIKKMN